MFDEWLKKIIRYLRLLAAALFFTGLIVCLANLKNIYHEVIVPNEKNLPESWQLIIEKITHRNVSDKIVYREEKTIKILEGWNTREISQYFEREGMWQSEELLELIGYPKYDYRQEKAMAGSKDFSLNYDFLNDKPKYYNLEGYLFPDTYRIYATSTLPEVVNKMLDNFGKKLTAKMRTDIKAQGRTIYQTVIMASIIEKEAPFNQTDTNNQGAKIISGIFWHRLKIGQALQSDATLSYFLDDKKPSHSGVELETDTLYNTYKYPGLPPTPICNPGYLALEAAVYPLDTDYNYFLTPAGSREVIFAKSYDEHLANKYKYLK